MRACSAGSLGSRPQRSGARLEGTNLRSADLRGAQVEPESLASAITAGCVGCPR
ncbi:MAG: pentapeptide repeat-containing protein [Geminicoccales bacterium]